MTEKPLSIIKGVDIPLIPLGKDYPLWPSRIIENTIHRLEKNRDATIYPDIQPIHSIDLKGKTVDNAYFLFKDQKMTYVEWNETSNRFARAMLQRIHKDQIKRTNNDGDSSIAIFVSSSLDMVKVMFAVFKTGAAYLPLDVDYPESKIRQILEDSPPLLIIAEKDSDGFEGFPVIKCDELLALSVDLAKHDLSCDEVLSTGKPESEHVFSIAYTSGSTGKPKGVRTPVRAIINRLLWQYKHHPFAEDETTQVVKSKIAFGEIMPELIGAVLYGQRVIIAPKEVQQNTELLIELMEKYKVGRIMIVVSHVTAMLAYLQMDLKSKPNYKPGMKTTRLSSVKLFLVTSEPFPHSLIKQFSEVFDEKNHKIVNMYGCTETITDVIWTYITYDPASEDTRVPSGGAYENNTVYVMDNNFRVIPQGEVGEVYVSGMNVAIGYVNSVDRGGRFMEMLCPTDTSRVVKMYRTGDMGMIENNVLYIQGRSDAQVKVRGHKVDVVEVEKALHSIAGLEGTVLVYKSGEANQNIVAFFSSPKMSTQQVQRELEKRLISYMVPTAFKVQQLPYLATSKKLDRSKLLEMYEASIETTDKKLMDYTGVPVELMKPAKVLYESVAALLKGRLREPITAASSFYGLGGDSLNSVTLLTTLQDRSYRVGISELLSAKTLLDIMKAMKHENDVGKTDTKAVLTEKYVIEMVKDKDKEMVKRIIADSFGKKDDLANWLETPVAPQEYAQVVESIWKTVVAQGYSAHVYLILYAFNDVERRKNFAKISFIIKDARGNAKAAVMNLDPFKVTHVTPKGPLKYCLELVENLEAPFMPKKKHKEVFYAFLGGAASENQPQENVEIFKLISEKNIEIATAAGFSQLVTTDTSPLTMQLDVDVLKFKEMGSILINTFTAADGTKPFQKAPDTAKAIVVVKDLKGK